MPVTSNPSSRIPVVALIGLLVVIVGVSLLFPPAQWIPARQWGAALESAGISGALAFWLLGTVATAVGMPRQLAAFIGGLAYGIVPGLLLSLLAALSGCYLTMRISRRFLAHWVCARYPAFIAQLARLLRHDVFSKILIVRLQPLGTNLLTNVCVGFTGVPPRLFMVASAIGYIPQMLVFTLLGAGVRVGSQTQLWLSVVLMMVATLLGIILWRRHTQRHTELS